MKHLDEAKKIWETQVPKEGQAKTVQGELLRIIEKLRDEAQRNGNQNWDDDFEVMRQYLRKYLGKNRFHSLLSRDGVNKDIKRLGEYERPYTDDDLYDRLVCRLIERIDMFPETLSHEFNPQLKR